MLPKLAFIIPCYNEEEIILDSLRTIGAQLKALITEKLINDQSFMVFVDDGSKDQTLRLLKGNKTEQTRIVKLTTNKGHQNALLAGLQYAQDKTEVTISIDADLQDDLNVVKEMIHKYNEGFQIVCGVRNRRTSDSIFKKGTAKIFYKFMNIMGVPIMHNHADFRLLSSKVITELLKYREVNLFLRGVFPLINMQLTTVNYDRQKREKGTTKYSFRKMTSLALKGVTSFSVLPMRIISVLGIAVFVVTLILSAYVVISKFQNKTVPGWASITLPLYFLGGIQLLCLGVIGEYIGKIYSETKQRPLYHIEEIIE